MAGGRSANQVACSIQLPVRARSICRRAVTRMGTEFKTSKRDEKRTTQMTANGCAANARHRPVPSVQVQRSRCLLRHLRSMPRPIFATFSSSSFASVKPDLYMVICTFPCAFEPCAQTPKFLARLRTFYTSFLCMYSVIGYLIVLYSLPLSFHHFLRLSSACYALAPCKNDHTPIYPAR